VRPVKHTPIGRTAVHPSKPMIPNEISQLLMIGIPADGDLAAVEELQPGGVILFARNAGTTTEVRRLTREIEGVCRTPPLIAIDQEGGRVQRLTAGFTRIPAMRELGQQGANRVGIMAMTVAAELRAVGIQCNFAPVCDVRVHPEDTIIGDRAFSDDPVRASLLAAEYIRGAQPTVLCVAKHFPGHGGVGVDSHRALPTFEGTRGDLDAIHLQPFRAAMAAGVGGMMIGHIAVPIVDESGAPASLSQPVVTGILRSEMNFRGLVFTDDLEMNALPQDDMGGVAVHALAAGCDMLLICHTPQKAKIARDAIAQAVNDGALPAERVRDSLEKVRWAKRKFGVTTE
jgi:beta-N-acetylhexosaminidase